VIYRIAGETGTVPANYHVAWVVIGLVKSTDALRKLCDVVIAWAQLDWRAYRIRFAILGIGVVRVDVQVVIFDHAVIVDGFTGIATSNMAHCVQAETRAAARQEGMRRNRAPQQITLDISLTDGNACVYGIPILDSRTVATTLA